MHHLETGRKGEKEAVEFLLKKGYRLEARNVRFPQGELDVIAWEGDCLCFIEVRTRTEPFEGHPLETLSRSKIRRLALAAQTYLLKQYPDKDPETRFDVLGIVHASDGSVEIDLLRDAFDSPV